ncbi:MAG: hypothetical protein H6736_14425 [Alphaproteobacteria bacterium]|nr:hypothetical protein [Alphaproteobacteria bacterium]
MAGDELQRWIEAVDRLAHDARPSREEAEAVARDLGLPPSLVEQARAEAEARHARGLRLLEVGQAAEAVRELAGAQALDPWSTSIEADLARARGALAARPDNRVLVGVSVVSLAVAALAVVWAWSVTSGGTGPVVDPVSVAPVASGAPVDVGVGGVPVRVDRTGLPDGIALEVARAERTDTADGWILSVAVVAHVVDPVIVSELGFVAEALDAKGQRLATHALAVLEDHQAAVGAGEQAQGQGYLSGTDEAGDPASIRLKVARAVVDPGELGRGEPVALAWPDGAGSTTAAVVRQRSGGTCRPSGLSDRGFCEGVYEVENTGSVPIDKLKVRVAFGEHEAVETYAIAGRARPVKPGERQAFRVIHGVSGVQEGPWTWSVVDVRTP